MATFRGADRGPLQDVWERKILPFLDKIPNDVEGLFSYTVSHPDTTLFISEASGMAAPQYINCDLMPLPGEYLTGYATFGIQKDSPYGEALNYFIRRLIESGSFDKLQLKYLRSTALTCKKNNHGQAIGIETAFPAIVIMVAGILISAILFLLEMFFTVFKQK